MLHANWIIASPAQTGLTSSSSHHACQKERTITGVEVTNCDLKKCAPFSMVAICDLKRILPHPRAKGPSHASPGQRPGISIQNEIEP
jgi:hypothetical protein